MNSLHLVHCIHASKCLISIHLEHKCGPKHKDTHTYMYILQMLDWVGRLCIILVRPVQNNAGLKQWLWLWKINTCIRYWLPTVNMYAESSPVLVATVGGGGSGYSSCGYTEKGSWLSTCTGEGNNKQDQKRHTFQKRLGRDSAVILDMWYQLHVVVDTC